MRKQYHFRPGTAGWLAWDVDKLIACTRGREIEHLPLEAVHELDECYWYASADSRPTCRSMADHMRLVQMADPQYPIIICPRGRIMDGMHRVVKALLEGKTSVRAYRLPVLPPPDHVDVDPDDLPYDEVG